MRMQIQVLAPNEQADLHERSLNILAKTGVRVLSASARQLLAQAGAEINPTTNIVRFPRPVVEDALNLSPRQFSLGGRRPGWGLEMNQGGCTLLADGEATSVLDFDTGELRPSTFDDWLKATRLIDAIDEIGIYWSMVDAGYADASGNTSPGDFVALWHNTFKYCSKHAQDSTDDPGKARLLCEILHIIFGDSAAIRHTHPFSYVLCPMSPLIIDDVYTDAYLCCASAGLNIPVAIMPMPLMGATGSASLISNLMLANCETLAALCLVQAAEPGAPVIYAPVPNTIEPHTWRFTGGAIENSLFGAAVTEMGRYYGLPVEASTGGTDQYYPGAQAGYERALNWAFPAVAYPDILVGPGLLGGSTILCLEQMLMDVEVFRRCKRIKEGISTAEERWLEDVIASAGPGADFLRHKSTLRAIREGRWYLSEVGFHNTYEAWHAAGMPDVLDEIPGLIQEMLTNHQPLPLDEAVERELQSLEEKMRQTSQEKFL